MIAAATPSSSARIVILVVTPDFAEYANRTRPVTLPPDTVSPYNLSECVELLRTTSVPSKGCKDSVAMSCSVASMIEHKLVIK